MEHQRVSRRPMARVCLALCILAALAVDLRVAAASAQPRPSGGAISSEEPTKTAATAATAGEEATPVKETPPKKEEGERPTLLYVKNHHPAGILTDVHVPMPRKKLMRSVATDARKGLEPEYECTSLAGPHCRTHGPTGDLLSDELSASSAEDGSLLIQLDDTKLGKDGKIDLAKVIEMFGGAMAKKARETAAGTNEAGTNEAGAAEVGDDADAAVREAREIAAKIGIGRANGVFEMHSPLAAGRRLRPDAVVGRGGEGLSSTPSRDDRKVEFINAREATSALYWLDFDGNEVHYVDLPPGMTTMMSTFGSHVWVSRDMATNAAVAAYAVTARKPGEPPVQHFIVTDVDFSDAMAAAAALMAQDTAEAPATAATAAKEDETPRETAAKEDETPRETAANDGDANDGGGTTETAARRRSGDRARIDAEIERRRRRHEAARAAAAARREKLLEEDPSDLRGAAERLERAKKDARALRQQVREAKEEARRRREEREARARDDSEL